MRTAAAQLPEFARSDDKVFTTANAVVVLDGVSAFRAVPVAAALYAEHLGTALRDQLLAHPAGDLRELLRAAIALVADTLNLSPGDSPSSTVSVARADGDHVDALTLGDSPLVLPTDRLEDRRVDELDLPERKRYLAHLAAGSGYTEQHRQLLQELQNRQARWRNTEGGYWIAEADPEAAAQAVARRYPVADNPWAVLATDGAFDLIAHLETRSWSEIADCGSTELHALLRWLHEWEAERDPHGQDLPRPKQHDDKAIAVVRWDS